MKRLFRVFSLVFLVSLVGCKTPPKDDEIIIPAEELYLKASSLYQVGSYKEAAEEFGKIYFQHPGGDLTPYAELMEAYNLYLAGEYLEAIDVLDNFIKIHPVHEDIAYAFYLKGLAYYMQISDIAHDQSITEKAKMAFHEVINRFPGSKYALDVALKKDLVDDHLAGKEIAIGRFYQKKKNPIGSINRFQIVVDNYQTTSHTPEALYRLTESFVMLGLKEEAVKYAAVLGYNYPESNWYKYAKKLVE